MTLWRRFAHLTLPEKMLLIRIAFLVLAVRVLLWTIPWPAVLGPLRALAAMRWLGFASRLSTDRLVWAVQAVSRRIPRATCLTQSLALQCVLTAAGRPSTVEIGVRKEAGFPVQAHAWIELEGTTLLTTAAEADRYSRMVTLHARPPR